MMRTERDQSYERSRDGPGDYVSAYTDCHTLCSETGVLSRIPALSVVTSFLYECRSVDTWYIRMVFGDEYYPSLKDIKRSIMVPKYFIRKSRF